MSERARLAVVGNSVIISGETITQAVAQKWEPAVIVWQLPTAAAVHVGFTVHTHMEPRSLSSLLRTMADEIDRRAADFPTEDRPLHSPEPQGGLSGSADSLDSGDNLPGG